MCFFDFHLHVPTHCFSMYWIFKGKLIHFVGGNAFRIVSSPFKMVPTLQGKTLLPVVAASSVIEQTSFRMAFGPPSHNQEVTKVILITKTCLYNFDPLKPHFYIVKLGFTGVNIIFLVSAQSIDCGYS